MITLAKPGCRTIAEADANPWTVDGKGVYVTFSDDLAELHIGGRIVASRPAAEIPAVRDAQDWAVEYLAARDERADADIEAFEQHVAETARLDESPLQRIRETHALQRISETHGKGGSFRTPSGAFITPADMGLAAMIAQRQHYRLLVAESGDGRWAVEFIEPDGSLYGRFHYVAG